MKKLAPAIAVLVVTVVLLFGVLPRMLDPIVNQMLYPAPPIAVPSPPPTPLEEFVLEIGDGATAVAWGLTHDRPESPAVVFFHGNGENLETLRQSGLFEQLGGLGAHVLAVEYPGYGGSTAKPREASLTAAGLAGFAQLGERYPDSAKVVLGWSLGAAVAMQTASRRAEEVDGLVLLSPWSSLSSLAAIHFPKWLVNVGLPDSYDSLEAARQISSPTLMIHGDIDQIIPVSEGRHLNAAMGERARWVEVANAGHNDLLSFGVVWDELAVFLRSLPGGN